MTEQELQQYIRTNYPKENEGCEWKEFKTMKNAFSGDAGNDVVSYVSALANMEGGHLVMGVEDKTLEIIGVDNYNYDAEKVRLRLKDQCANLPTEGLRLHEFRTDDTQKLVWVLAVPKHNLRLPVYAHSRAWQRLDDSLVEMTQSRLNAILDETPQVDDWSAKIIPEATIDDLDPKAIQFAREKYIELHSDREQEIRSWDDTTFLNKACITRQGQITNTAVILLGRPESQHFISPAVCKVRWSQKSRFEDSNLDFKVFTPPMILAIEELKNKIHNTTYTYTVQGSLFPESMPRYDVFTLREPLCNAIAHQDYAKSALIDVVEYIDDRLLFRNHGHFIPLSVEDVVKHDFPEENYRNPFLVEAMRNVRMVETEGGGIKKLYLQQKKRFFPMPTYDLSDEKVVCMIEGRILDENFAKILLNNPDLSLGDIMLLDKVQKHLPISDEALQMLRKRKFVEGKRPNIYLSHSIVKTSQHIGLQTSYIKNKSFNDNYYKDLILQYITQFKSASRVALKELINDKLSDTLNEKQKFDKLTNLLSSLKKAGKIRTNDKREWVLVNDKI